MSNVEVRLEHDETLARVVLNAPKGNILDTAMIEGLIAANRDLARRPTVKLMVLEGAESKNITARYTTMYLLQTPTYQPIREYTKLIMNGQWEQGIAKYNEVEPGRRLLNDFFWENYRKGVYVVGYWKYWLKLRGLISNEVVRPPLINITEDQKSWMEKRVAELPW